MCRIEGPGGEAAAVLNGGHSLLRAQQLQQVSVGILAGDNDHVAEVLCGGADEGDASDVYLLDDLLLRCALGDIFPEGVEVHDDQVNAWNLIFFPLLEVSGLLPAVEDSSHYLRMEGLDASSEDGGVSCYVLYGCNRNVMVCQIVLGASCGEYLHSQVNQLISNVQYEILIVHRDKCSPNRSVAVHKGRITNLL